MRRIRTTMATLAALLLSAAIAGPVLATSEPDTTGVMAVDLIEGITWQLQEQRVDGALVAIPADVSVTLLMEDGEVSGNAGCNNYFGSYERDGEALTFGPMGATQMFCEGAPGEVESQYLANLVAVASGFSNGGQLTLADADGNPVLVLAPAAEVVLPVEAIEGPTWLLVEQAVDGAMTALPGGVVVTLRLQDGQAGGSGGCNSYFASYTLDGSSLTFGEIGSTLMACPEPAMETESSYLGNLALVASWMHDGARLSLSDADGTVILVYEMAPEVTIVGSWVATGINNGVGGVVSSATTSEVTANFSADGELTGFDGCNQYFTSYSVDGESIVISDAIGSTRMACASDELAEQSSQYLAALTAATTWSIAPSGTLELRDESGALQVSFEPAQG